MTRLLLHDENEFIGDCYSWQSNANQFSDFAVSCKSEEEAKWSNGIIVLDPGAKRIYSSSQLYSYGTPPDLKTFTRGKRTFYDRFS